MSGGSTWRGPVSGGSTWRGPVSGGSTWRGPVSGGSTWRGPVSGGSMWRSASRHNIGAFPCEWVYCFRHYNALAGAALS